MGGPYSWEAHTNKPQNVWWWITENWGVIRMRDSYQLKWIQLIPMEVAVRQHITTMGFATATAVDPGWSSSHELIASGPSRGPRAPGACCSQWSSATICCLRWWAPPAVGAPTRSSTAPWPLGWIMTPSHWGRLVSPLEFLRFLGYPRVHHPAY